MQLISPYITSILKVQIHYQNFRGLQALSWHFIIMLSPMDAGINFEHFFKVSCQNPLKMSPFLEGIQKLVLFWPSNWGCSRLSYTLARVLLSIGQTVMWNKYHIIFCICCVFILHLLIHLLHLWNSLLSRLLWIHLIAL